jgi:hypothetical protein
MFLCMEHFFPNRGLLLISAMEYQGMGTADVPKGKEMTDVNTAFDPVSAALKQMHAEIEREPLPDDFLRILEEIDAKIAAAKTVQ